MKSLHARKVLLLLLTFSSFCSCVIYTKFSDLPTARYDFIVVGGGTAGNVIANRLTENPKFSVLVLEAGGSHEGVLITQVPFFKTLLGPPSAVDWNYTMTPQPGLNGRTTRFSRGRILGGCSSLNGMAWTRGSSEDFDRFARVTGDPGWSWQRLQPYILKNERWTPPADHHDTRGQFDPSIHGFHGVLAVSLSGFPVPISNRVIQTTKELEEFPFNLDQNSGNELGIGWAQVSVNGGMRDSSATSYLGPKYIARPNLHVLVNAQVTRLLQTSSSPGNVAFKAVEFATDAGAPRRRVSASREVIISGGAIGTPQVLLNSGIGDQTDLAKLGIKTRVHLPDVGKNLSVQTSVGLAWFVNSTDTYDDIVRNATFRAELLEDWKGTQKGPLVNAIADHFIYSRVPKNATVFTTHPDPAAGPHTPHFQITIENGIPTGPPPTGNYLTLAAGLSTPTSRGSIKLNTTNPFDQPLIDMASLGSGWDIFGLREAAKAAQRFLTAPAWNGYILGPLGDLANATTDALLEQYIRAHAAPNGHIVATASMSPKQAKYGVLDPDLRVKGVSGLRVVDASVMPFVPAANTMASIYIVAERGADLIKAAWQ